MAAARRERASFEDADGGERRCHLGFLTVNVQVSLVARIEEEAVFFFFSLSKSGEASHVATK